MFSRDFTFAPKAPIRCPGRGIGGRFGILGKPWGAFFGFLGVWETSRKFEDFSGSDLHTCRGTCDGLGESMESRRGGETGGAQEAETIPHA